MVRRPVPVAAAAAVLMLGLALVAGCAAAPPSVQAERPAAAGPASDSGAATAGGESGRPGATVVALEFVRAWENVPSAVYYPLDGLAGCMFTDEGTLVVCDEQRGKVWGLDPGDLQWYEFDVPGVRPYRPVDAVVDGFKVLVLDSGSNAVYRFDLGGAYRDQVVDLRRVDPTVRTQVSAFALDRDGRMVVTDVSEQQVLLLDAFLDLSMRVGGPGAGSDQLRDPSGLAFLPDGSFVVADRANRRLSVYGRLGFFERTVGGDFTKDNPFVAPQGLAVDRKGNIFIADMGSGSIHVLDARLRPTLSAGPDFGLQAMPKVPVDVAVGPGDLLAVTDRARSAILIYRIIYE
ncbi:MAG TPA: NHL repeat-containing protein [Candidatus Krumholzibacteria bacterium]|nr:NHL repeat-containing protein [Candidatus Krumholzibacteria bacterium]